MYKWMQRHNAVRKPTQMTGLCKTTHTKSGDNDDKPSGKWKHTVQQAKKKKSLLFAFLALCPDDKSYPGVNILRIIELIVVCKFLCLESESGSSPVQAS